MFGNFKNIVQIEMTIWRGGCSNGDNGNFGIQYGLLYNQALPQSVCSDCCSLDYAFNIFFNNGG